jgi:Protein of unknown function (DUF3800)
MSFTHIAYVDEAGDEGLGKLSSGTSGGQSRWLLLGAAIVRGADDPDIPKYRDAIMDRFPNKRRRDLHFRELKHEQKVVVAQEIAKLPVKTCITLSHKATLVGSGSESRFREPGLYYRYMTRWLLERVSTQCARDAQKEGIQGRLRVVFSRRGGTDYNSMTSYMEFMRDGRERIQPARSIDWSVFDPSDIAVENHGVRAGLQLADAVTSAFFVAVEPNLYGNYDTTYADILRGSVLRLNGNALNTGVSPVPGLDRCGADELQRAFLESFRK